MLRRLIASLAVFALILTISTSASGRQGATPMRVSTADYDGIIFPAEMKAFRGEFPKGVGYWTPSESEVLAAEKQLVPFLRGSSDPRVKEILNKISTYKRQYVGVIVAGQKYLYFNLFCLAPNYWTRSEVIVLDGGSCFFNVRFSNETKTFSHFRVNGVA